MIKELYDLIAVLDDAVDMRDNSKYHDALDNAYQDGILHDLRRHLNKQTKLVQELEGRLADDKHFVAEIMEQNKRYREWIEYLLEEAKDHKRKGMRIQHWALINDLEKALEESE